ncbi:MAG: ATP-binding protein [Candidatus Levybacteria bacterium]|nr:ATP-binding protein [Candidatus Levybacteria bacterium]
MIRGKETGKEYLNKKPEFTVNAEGSADLHKWLTINHNATMEALGNESPLLEVGEIDMQDSFIKHMQSILQYDSENLEFELATALTTDKKENADQDIPLTEAVRKAIGELPKLNLNLKKIQNMLIQRLQPIGYEVLYQGHNELIGILDIIKRAEDRDDNQDYEDSQTEFAFHPISTTDYCFHFVSDPQQSKQTFEKNYQLYAVMLGHVVNAVCESEGKSSPAKTYELRPQHNISSLIERMNNRIAMQKGYIRSAGITVFGEETTNDEAVGKIRPDNMKYMTFDDIGGHEEAKKRLRLGILGLMNPEKFTQQGAIPPTKFLLNGPTGTGKTSLAIATAREASVPTYSMQVGNILRSLVGASEQRVRDTFAQARKDGKAVIILDELDAIARSRVSYMHGITTTLMTELDGISNNSNILVIGTTNLRETIDPGMLRAGRFNHIIDVQLPETKDLEKIFVIHMNAAEKRAQRRLFDGLDLELLASHTKGLSGADIEEIVQRVVNQRIIEQQFLGIEPPEFETNDRIMQKIKEYDPVRKGKGMVGFVASHNKKTPSN